MDFVRPARSLKAQLVGGRGHYEAVIRAVMAAEVSVWIATANVKELMVEDARAKPGVRRRVGQVGYRSVLAVFDELAGKGVELRLLHAGVASGPFAKQLRAFPRLMKGGLAMRMCPRVHFKTVIVDGAQVYVGSANWTGAGLGAKGEGRRNFELGILSRDDGLLDEVQGLYDQVWRGAACQGCRLRDECPAPLDELGKRV